MLCDVTSLSLPLASPSPPPNAIDPTVLAALITATVALLAAFISAGVALYQIRRNARLEKEKITVQLEVERERIRYQDQINAARADQERQRHRREMSDEEARTAVERAQTMTERVAAYRDALCADPRLSQLQILDMHHPMPVDQVFVRVRLHQEAKPSHELDPILLKAEEQRDPNELLRVSRLSLENRASTALDPEEAIGNYHRCVVVGDPGAGKTTLLKHLALKAAKCQLSGLPDFPIHIELSVFAGSRSHSHDLLDFISSRWENRYGFPKADARQCIEAHLQAGTALLLLDALDETVVGTSTEEAEASYRHVIDTISQLAARYHQTRIVVTARKAGYHQRTRLVGFTELEVLDFRSEDIEQFIDNWFAHSPRMQATTDASDLKVRLSRNTRLQTLAANPLLLSLIVIVYEANLDLPDRRAELYKQCVDILLTKWDASRDIRRRREFKPDHKKQLLEEVAWHFHNQGRRYLPQSELLQIIADFLPVVGLTPDQNAGILEEIASENGLLKEQAHHWYGFLHLTLQEYFVALSLADHQGIEALVQHIGDPWWEEIFFLYAGHTPDASPLLQKLLSIDSQEPLQDDIFHTQLVLAGRCLAARPAIRRTDLREVIIQRLFQDLRSTPLTLLQSRVAHALAEIGGSSINTQLLHLLADPNLNSFVGMNIAQALGQLGERSVAPDLLRLLADPNLDSSLRMNIAQALGQLGERSFAPDLLRLLADPNLNSFVCSGIANALGQLGEPSVAPDLLRLLADPNLDSFVCSGIANALGQLGEPSVAPDLLRLLADPNLDSSLRMSIASALGQLGEPSVAPDLLRLLADPNLDSSLRMSIASALGQLGERSVAPVLLRLLADPNLDSSLRMNIANVLGQLGEPSVAPDLLRLLADPNLDSFVCSGIASALGQLGEPSVAPDLLRLLADPNLDSSLRMNIAQALGQLGEPSVAPELLRLLADPNLNSFVCSGIANALGQLGEPSVAPDLLRLLVDPNLASSVYVSIAKALGQLGEPSVAPVLLRLLADPNLDRSLRRGIASALGQLGEPSVAPDLLRLLADPTFNSSLRWNVAEALGQLGDDTKIVHDLASLLEKSDISDTIFTALWTISQRMRVRIYRVEGPVGAQYEIVDLNK